MPDKCSGFTTLTGIPVSELQARLDAELPAAAYSQVPGAADLTDIDPGYMRHVLNTVFGISGFGWGIKYNSEDLVVTAEQRGQRTVYSASLAKLEFWYKLASDNVEHLCILHASGGSENSNTGYAMKGAITNALGQAVSNLGFQESVYMGLRSHRTVGKAAPAPAQSAAAASAQAAKPAAVPTVQSPAPASAAGDFVVPTNLPYGGKPLREVPIGQLRKFARITSQEVGRQAAAHLAVVESVAA